MMVITQYKIRTPQYNESSAPINKTTVPARRTGSSITYTRVYGKMYFRMRKHLAALTVGTAAAELAAVWNIK